MWGGSEENAIVAQILKYTAMVGEYITQQNIILNINVIFFTCICTYQSLIL